MTKHVTIDMAQSCPEPEAPPAAQPLAERFGGGLSKAAGARGPNAIDEMKLARLKRQWRAEWDAEARAAAAAEHAKSLEDSDEILLRINAKLERSRQNWIAEMSPRVRALHDAFEEARTLEEELAAQPPLPLLPGLDWHHQRRPLLERGHGHEEPQEDDTAEWYAIATEGAEGEEDGDGEDGDGKDRGGEDRDGEE